ncbi:RNA polymerase sigma factor [Actinomadura verrucosospora]|uniref:RNA polymerase sigma factor n=1 Tax=Actinomadura verrucosospora TaxID=46165 RepID=UPI0015667E50|nr:sigma-70 family RNA polymerase sigma factor [Actinomadura verrucosospora]
MIETFVHDRAGPARTRGRTTVDEASFTALFNAHYGPLVRLAGLLGADDPEDIAQDAFARYYRKRRRLRDDAAAFAYLRSTVCNLTRNRRRHLGVVRRALPVLFARSDEDVPADFTALVREEHRELLAALDALPAKQREVLVLRYWMDLSEREISKVMGISAGTVKSHAHRAVAALQGSLREKA